MIIVITANGSGTRMKGLSPKPKHELYLGEKRIIEHLLDTCNKYGQTYCLTSYKGEWQAKYPGKIINCEPAATRKDTLENIKGWEDVLIVDCDVVFPALPAFDQSTDAIFYFESTCTKYAGLMDDDGELLGAEERGTSQTKRASGAYFVKSVDRLLARMVYPDSIASGMIGARMIRENNFIRVGDVEDYMKAL